MQSYPVHVHHGRQHVATLTILAPDKRHAIAMAVNSVRVVKSLPVQYALYGTVAETVVAA